jgi:hypothetical protein
MTFRMNRNCRAAEPAEVTVAYANAAGVVCFQSSVGIRDWIVTGDLGPWLSEVFAVQSTPAE